jgi:hypothetical protein
VACLQHAGRCTKGYIHSGTVRGVIASGVRLNLIRPWHETCLVWLALAPSTAPTLSTMPSVPQGSGPLSPRTHFLQEQGGPGLLNDILPSILSLPSSLALWGYIVVQAASDGSGQGEDEDPAVNAALPPKSRPSRRRIGATSAEAARPPPSRPWRPPADPASSTGPSLQPVAQGHNLLSSVLSHLEHLPLLLGGQGSASSSNVGASRSVG